MKQELKKGTERTRLESANQQNSTMHLLRASTKHHILLVSKGGEHFLAMSHDNHARNELNKTILFSKHGQALEFRFKCHSLFPV